MIKAEIGVVLRRLCFIVGGCLLVAAALTLALWNLNVERTEKQREEYVDILQELMPEPQDAVPEERRDNAMSVLSVDGTDFVGLLEMPRYGSVLPVGAKWGKSSKYPCRFDGSIYDGTMQVGATTQRGQYDFYRELSVGDTVIYTDMEGNRYTFEVTGVRNENHVDQAALQREEAAFTLFIKNIYSFEYMVVFCNAAN